MSGYSLPPLRLFKEHPVGRADDICLVTIVTFDVCDSGRIRMPPGDSFRNPSWCSLCRKWHNARWEASQTERTPREPRQHFRQFHGNGLNRRRHTDLPCSHGRHDVIPSLKFSGLPHMPCTAGGRYRGRTFAASGRWASGTQSFPSQEESSSDSAAFTGFEVMAQTWPR